MKKLYIPPVLAVYCIISMIALHVFVPQLNLIRFPYNLAGIIIAISGFALMGKARELFKKYKTTVHIERSSHLIKEGVFSKTRNPMYIGMFILLLGFSVFSTNVVALVMPITFLVLVRIIFIRKEEQLMQGAFGENYNEYKKAVRRWI